MTPQPKKQPRKVRKPAWNHQPDAQAKSMPCAVEILRRRADVHRMRSDLAPEDEGYAGEQKRIALELDLRADALERKLAAQVKKR